MPQGPDSSGSNGLVVPQHVAIIMDGNGRWAERRGLPRIEGHRRGANCAREAVATCLDHGVKFLTLYAFSTENWSRPLTEVLGIFGLMADIMDKAIDFARERGVRFQSLGRTDGLPPKVQEIIARATEATRDLRAFTVSVCLNYGARDEILTAVRRLMSDGVAPGDVSESLFARYLHTSNLPDPDLIIRTGGEQRLSNFLLWQAAYAELYFTDVLWPDFRREELVKALESYGGRQRRFGTVSGVGK